MMFFILFVQDLY
uniref:Uncharacterized protein n=1 Tax=Arundo donax TaxID=35708 RepID=A0A0A9GRZ7_ARUDO